jgi:hypothetical protein
MWNWILCLKGLYKLLGDLEIGIWVTVWNFVSSECWTGFDSTPGSLDGLRKAGNFLEVVVEAM